MNFSVRYGMKVSYEDAKKGLEILKSALRSKTGLGWREATELEKESARQTDMARSLEGSASALTIPKIPTSPDARKQLEGALQLLKVCIPANGTFGGTVIESKDTLTVIVNGAGRQTLNAELSTAAAAMARKA